MKVVAETIHCRDYTEVNENYSRDIIRTVHFHCKCVSKTQQNKSEEVEMYSSVFGDSQIRSHNLFYNSSQKFGVGNDLCIF